MTLQEMLSELRRMVESGEITNDCCGHENPANAPDFCEVCFIINLSDHVSEDDVNFTEETTDLQRETIQLLWDEYCDEI